MIPSEREMNRFKMWSSSSQSGHGLTAQVVATAHFNLPPLSFSEICLVSDMSPTRALLSK